MCVLVCCGNSRRNEPAEDNVSIYDEVVDVDHYDEIGPCTTPDDEDTSYTEPAYTVPVDATGRAKSGPYDALFEGTDITYVNDSAANEAPDSPMSDMYLHPPSDTNGTNDVYLHPSEDTDDTYLRPSSDTSDDAYIHPQ